MELVDIDSLDLQRPQRILKLLAYIFCRPQLISLEMTSELMPELGGHNPIISLTPDSLSDQLFREMVAIAFGGVNQIDTEFLCQTEITENSVSGIHACVLSVG